LKILNFHLRRKTKNGSYPTISRNASPRMGRIQAVSGPNRALREGELGKAAQNPSGEKNGGSQESFPEIIPRILVINPDRDIPRTANNAL
jgi:hypothetical protein